MALGYLLLNLAYSFWLKHVVIIDAFVLASFYVLRVHAGVVLITVERFSPWLYTLTGLGALFLGFGKRRAEIMPVEPAGQAPPRAGGVFGHAPRGHDRRRHRLDRDGLRALHLLAENLPENHAMMLTIPFVLYGVFRYLYLVYRKGEGGSPGSPAPTARCSPPSSSGSSPAS